MVAEVVANAALNVSGQTNVNATSAATHTAKADSFAGGLLAVGVSKSSASSSVNVAAVIGNNANNTGGSLNVAATRDHSQMADNLAGGGGARRSFSDRH